MRGTAGRLMQVRRLNPQGVAAWWHGGHPGWAIYPVDSDHFMSTGVLDSLPVPTDDISSASPQSANKTPPPLPTYIHTHAHTHAGTQHTHARTHARREGSCLLPYDSTRKCSLDS